MAASQEVLTSPPTNMSATKGPVAQERTISDSTVDTEAGKPLVARHTSALASMSSVKKTVLLLIFSMAQFLDVCQVSGVAIAVAEISHDTGLQFEQSVWIITAYSLAFCSFLLFAGRLSDLFPARIIFCGGFFALGVITLGTSFAGGSKYAFLVLRGLGGVFGAATIPSAIHLIVHMYPEPAEQQAKLALFGVSGALGNVLGLVLAGIFMLANWRWFFRFITIICIPGSILTFLLLPKVGASYDRHAIPGPLWKRLDMGGVFIMIVTLALLNTGLTQGPIVGWDNAQFIAPFTISMVGFIFFFLYERWIDQANALLPMSVIRIKNFKILMVGALTPFAFWATTQLQYAQYLQEVRHWSPIHTAAAILPQGIMGLVVGGLTQAVPQIISKPRYPALAGGVLMIGGTILVIFSDGGYGTDYWAFIFTGYVIGSTGACLVFFACNVGVIRAVPPEMAGVAGGIVQVSLQVGGIIGLTALAGLSATGDGIQDWDASRSGFYFLIAWIAIIIIAFVLLYRSVPDEELPGAIDVEGRRAQAVEKALTQAR